MDRVIDGFFFLDVMVNFRTTYLDQKKETYERDGKKIALHYIKGRFFVDIIASFPISDFVSLSSANVSQTELKVFSMLKLVRLLRLGRIITFLQMN